MLSTNAQNSCIDVQASKRSPCLVLPLACVDKPEIPKRPTSPQAIRHSRTISHSRKYSEAKENPRKSRKAIRNAGEYFRNPRVIMQEPDKYLEPDSAQVAGAAARAQVEDAVAGFRAAGRAAMIDGGFAARTAFSMPTAHGQLPSSHALRFVCECVCRS